MKTLSIKATMPITQTSYVLQTKTWSVAIVLLLALLGLQPKASAQCDNLGATVTANPHLFGNGSFGQSVVVGGNCGNGNSFESFTFAHAGNSRCTMDLEIFSGQSTAPNKRVYVQAGIPLKPGNKGSESTIAIGGGTGSLIAETGKTYTFLFTIKSGNMIVRFSSNKVQGQGYNSVDNGFQLGRDMLFKVTTDNCNSCTIPGDLAVGGHFFSGDAFGQSFTVDGCYGEPSLSQLTYRHQGNSRYIVTVELFSGQTTQASSRVYEKKGIIVSPGNFGGLTTIDLKGGTGSLAVTDGNTYTLTMTLTNGNQIISFTSGIVPGQGYAHIKKGKFINGDSANGFQSGLDLLFCLEGN